VHTARRRSTFHNKYQPWDVYPDKEDDDYHIVKEEADEAMEDAAPPGAEDLPPEYQAIEDVLLQQVLEASKAYEEKAFFDYDDAIALMGMVAEHMASLPPPPSLPPHVPLLATYEGQEVLPLPDVLRRQRRHDHPHGVVINPSSQPQPKVMSTSSPMTSSWQRHSRCPKGTGFPFKFSL
jgi:hypothetical protein